MAYYCYTSTKRRLNVVISCPHHKGVHNTYENACCKLLTKKQNSLKILRASEMKSKTPGKTQIFYTDIEYYQIIPDTKHVVPDIFILKYIS